MGYRVANLGLRPFLFPAIPFPHPTNKKTPAEARVFKNQKPKFMKPFTCSHMMDGYRS